VIAERVSCITYKKRKGGGFWVAGKLWHLSSVHALRYCSRWFCLWISQAEHRFQMAHVQQKLDFVYLSGNDFKSLQSQQITWKKRWIVWSCCSTVTHTSSTIEDPSLPI
jgi:hypothetical protein